MLAGPGIIAPAVSEGGGSWVWALLAIGVVLGALAIMWIARLWGRAMPRGDALDLPVAGRREDRIAA
jgi:hypothetical protein